MNQIRLHAPETVGRSVRFRWEVAPRSRLYRAHALTLRFPEPVSIGGIPEALWWTIALICLHSHWTVLRPCRVELPIGLPPEELAFWGRLLHAEVTTLESLRGTRDFDSEIAIDARGPRLESAVLPADSGRCATAFSGGKDSLLQAAILAELTPRPILVATTSPMPPLQDHVTERRRQILAQMSRHRALMLVEVHSNFRASWDNHFADRQGYPVAINEMTDAFLYLGALLAVGAAFGATHLFLASEAEVQENVEREGRVIQHPHYMYSVATQRALQALLARRGFRYGSLTSPLHSEQVQRLLWTRYPKLSPLQYSCWQVREPRSACSECTQCLRIALTALAQGQNPERMGIDLVLLFQAQAQWSPRIFDKADGELLPNELVTRGLHAQTVRAVAQTPPWRVARAVLRAGWRRAAGRDARRALRAYAKLRRRVAGHPLKRAEGYRARFLAAVDPLVRERLAAIYAKSFAEEPEGSYAGILARSDALARWISEPLGGVA